MCTIDDTKSGIKLYTYIYGTCFLLSDIRCGAPGDGAFRINAQFRWQIAARNGSHLFLLTQSSRTHVPTTQDVQIKFSAHQQRQQPAIAPPPTNCHPFFMDTHIYQISHTHTHTHSAMKHHSFPAYLQNPLHTHIYVML